MTQGCRYKVSNGPAWEDIALSLRDTVFGLRTVKFEYSEPGFCGRLPVEITYDAKVQITGAKRLDSRGETWELTGQHCAQAGNKDVAIFFRTDSRKGHLRFVDPPQTDVGAKKADALMGIIHSMIATYQEHNPGRLSELVFQLYDVAKNVSWSKDEASIARALKGERVT